MQNIGNMMKQVQQMQARAAEMQTRIAEMTVEGQSGGGMVKVMVTGTNDVKKISLDKSVVDATEIEMLEDLIIAALKDAKNKIDAALADEQQKLMGGMKLPAGMKLPF